MSFAALSRPSVTRLPLMALASQPSSRPAALAAPPACTSAAANSDGQEHTCHVVLLYLPAYG
eukprot:scaffold22957_cov58-Phaeocystis_antarctica.AAC.1